MRTLLLFSPRVQAVAILYSGAIVRTIRVPDSKNMNSRAIWRVSYDYGSTWARLPYKAAGIQLLGIYDEDGFVTYNATILGAVPSGFVTFHTNFGDVALVPDNDAGRAWAFLAEQIMEMPCNDDDAEDAMDERWEEHSLALHLIGGRWL
jgi:hypothetical protein